MLEAALRSGAAERAASSRCSPGDCRPDAGTAWWPAPGGCSRRCAGSGSGRTSSPGWSGPAWWTPRRCGWLADYRFTGDVWGYGEGECYLPGSPVLIVHGSFAQTVILETLVLSILNHDSAVAAAASRMTAAAQGRPCLEMGSRRTHERAAVAAARAAYIAGFVGTSNLEAGRRYGVPTIGTAAHAFTLVHDDERTAFAAQVDALGTGHHAAGGHLRRPMPACRPRSRWPGSGWARVRLDSGDLLEQAHAVRAQLDRLGARQTRIVVTSDLDEYAIAALAAAPVDAYGVGTSLVTGSGAPTAAMVYKLVAREDAGGELIGVAKRSEGKPSLAGRKFALRRRGSDGVAVAEVIGIGHPPEDGGNDRRAAAPSGRRWRDDRRGAAGGCPRPARVLAGRTARHRTAALPRRARHPHLVRAVAPRTPAPRRRSHDPSSRHRRRAERLLRGRLAGRRRRRRRGGRHHRAPARALRGVRRRGRHPGLARRPRRALLDRPRLRGQLAAALSGRDTRRRAASRTWTPDRSRPGSPRANTPPRTPGSRARPPRPAGRWAWRTGCGRAAWARSTWSASPPTTACGPPRWTPWPAGFATRVLLDLTAGVARETTENAVAALRAAGAELVGEPVLA